MVKKISIDQVSVGMFLEDVFDKNGRLLLTENSMIVDWAQIDNLRRRGIRSVYINVSRGADVEEEVVETEEISEGSTEDISFEDARREEAYYQEIERAREIHQRTFQAVRETLSSIRVGKSFSTRNVERAAQEIVESIMRNADALVSLCQIKGHDEYTFEHSLHVGILVSSLAGEMGYDDDRILQIGMGGLLHDIGKMRVPEAILNHPGRYEPWQFAIMKQHPDHGLTIIRENKKVVSDAVKAVIGQHHERFDGSGYPRKLRGEEIDETALISGVADVYDALTTDRIYREAWTPQKALATIFQGCDKEYSRKIVERFTKHLGIYPVGSFVRLSSGELALVTRVNSGHIMAPEVLILFGPDGNRLAQPQACNLFDQKDSPDNAGRIVEISVDPKPYNVRVADYITTRGA